MGLQTRAETSLKKTEELISLQTVLPLPTGVKGRIETHQGRVVPCPGPPQALPPICRLKF
jgi:hypothetical protein